MAPALTAGTVSTEALPAASARLPPFSMRAWLVAVMPPARSLSPDTMV